MSFGDFAIAPSTTVTLCHGVPLSKDSEDTYYFGSAGEQAATIGGYAIPGATFSNLTYQRNTRNTIRVGLPMGVSGANSALRANYVIFKNTAFENKPIYAFVDKVDYVNNNTIDVTFTIDAMQTFAFDYTLRECYVEREHSATDVIGDNVIPEAFTTLTTVINNVDEQFLFANPSGFLNTKYKTVIYHTKLDDASAYTGDVVNNVFIGCDITKCATTTLTVNQEINNIISQGGTIMAIAAVPERIANNNNGYIGSGNVAINSTFVDDTRTYTPRNNKMFTYPYNYLTVSNNAGEEHQYRWEWFKQNAAHFGMYGGFAPAPECALVPYNYRGSQVNYGEMCYLNNFPSSCWNEDSFMNWYLRNSNSYAASTTNNTFSTMSTMLSGALAGAAIGGMQGSMISPGVGSVIGAAGGLITGINNARSLEAQAKDAYATPDKTCGNAAANVVNEIIGCTGFTIYKMNLCYDQAVAVDNFFTMYGYATQRVKVPNRNVRPRFTYTKTNGCTVYGDIPAEFAREIEARYNSGVRFWKAGATIGDYATANEP